jgi:hypothetical protein
MPVAKTPSKWTNVGPAGNEKTQSIKLEYDAHRYAFSRSTELYTHDRYAHGYLKLMIQSMAEEAINSVHSGVEEINGELVPTRWPAFSPSNRVIVTVEIVDDTHDSAKASE